MLRKLILFAITLAIVKRLIDRRRAKRTPFPTSSRPAQGPMRRA